MVSIHLKTNQNPRGAGFWKFDTSLLSDIDYINVIKETIKNVVNLYKYDASVNKILREQQLCFLKLFDNACTLKQNTNAARLCVQIKSGSDSIQASNIFVWYIANSFVCWLS